MRTTQPENFKKWLDALRSGEYRQWRTTLAGGGNFFCCLGVACEISNVGQWEDKRRYMAESRAGSSALPPREVLAWLGIEPENSDILSEVWKQQDAEGMADHVRSLTVWVKAQDGDFESYDTGFGNVTAVSVINDNGGSFDEIADRLEATYLG